MKDILKVWWRGYGEGPTFVFGSIFTIIGLILLVLVKFLLWNETSFNFLILGVLSLIGALIIWIIGFILPFSAIKRFKKEFGFLPPITPEGRDPYQRQVDYLLGEAARTFFTYCDEQDRLLSNLKSLSKGEVNRSSFIEDISRIDEQLRQVGVSIKESGDEFWRLRAIASDYYLPCPFKVLDSRDGYKEVTFYNLAKHEKDKVREQPRVRHGN